MSVYKVEVWEKYILEVDAENKADAVRVAHNKRIKAIGDRHQLSTTKIDKVKWLRKSEENEDADNTKIN